MLLLSSIIAIKANYGFRQLIVNEIKIDFAKSESMLWVSLTRAIFLLSTDKIKSMKACVVCTVNQEKIFPLPFSDTKLKHSMDKTLSIFISKQNLSSRKKVSTIFSSRLQKKNYFGRGFLPYPCTTVAFNIESLPVFLEKS